MGIKEFYFGLEDKYYAGLDWLDHHHIPVYKVVDAIEAQNIPSFPIACFLLLLLVGGLFVFVSGGAGILGGGSTLSVLVQDDTQTPLAGISVQLTGKGLPGDALAPRLTDSSGKVTFAGLPPGTLVNITASAEGYAITPASVVLDAGGNSQSLTGNATLAAKSILLHLYKTGTNESFAQPVELQFACSGNAAFAPRSTITNGQIALDVPGDCGVLTASPSDSQVNLDSSVIDIDASQPSIGVSITPRGNAVLRITLLDASGNGISGLTTIIKSKFGDQLAQKFTDSGGFVEFTGLVPDTYVIFTPADGVNGEFDSGPFQVDGDTGSPVQKTFTVQAASVGEVRLQLVDEGSLAPVSGARVTLSKGNQSLFTKTSNDGGQVTFTVSSTNNLSVSVDHPAYLIKSGIAVSVSSAGYTQMPMTKATLQNSQIVTVNVIDELGQPVENAYVALKKSPSGTSVGTNKITGASGSVMFSSLEEGTYFASAYKPGFSDQLRSDIFTVKARENVQTSVKLVLGNGTITFAVKGADGQPLAGATIQPVDAGTHASIGSEITTGVDGGAELTLRADKLAYFVVREPNHLPYVTIPVQVKKSLTQTVNAGLVRDIQKLEIKPLGTFVNGTPILEDSGLAPGQTYTVRFGLYVPRNSIFSETGAHIRTGNASDGQTNQIENDDWSIRAVRGAFSKIQAGTTYTPPTGLGTDAQHLTNGDAKWTNVTFAPMNEGLTILEVDITVKDTIGQGADLPLYYRAWGKTGSFVRYPVDAVLGGSDSVTEKQGLYANANLKLYSTGAGTHLCNKDLCLGMVAEDLTSQLQTPLTTDYTIDVGTRHQLLFTFTSISDNVFADTSLLIQSSSSSADLKTYEVTNAVGAKKSGTVSGNKVEIPIGSIQKNNVVFGFVGIGASKEGSARVKLSLVSNKKELFSRELLVKVNAAGKMSVNVVPKAILPLLVNQLLVHVAQSGGGGEGIPLEDAGVSIKLNGTLLTSGFTNMDGVFPFELHEPNVNDEVTLTTEKPGYSPVTLTIRVGADIIGFVPEQVNETLVVNGTAKKTRDIRAFNLASVPLTIKEISISGDFEGLVKFDLLNDEIVGNVLPVNGDQNITFALSLTEKGQKLLNPRTLKGSLVMKTDAGSTGKTFVNTLPLNVKLGFGGEVDVEKCLLIDPAKWDIFTDPAQTKQRAVEIKNSCTVKGVPVKLTNLSAKIKQLTGDMTGTFTAAAGSKSVELGTEYKTILSEISAGETITVNMGFTPHSIESGTASPQVVFQATNLTDNGVPDFLNATLQTSIVINSLTKCMRVNAPNPATIESCPINTGAGQYGNYFGQVYRPPSLPYYNPQFAVLNQTSNPSGSSLLPSSVSGGFGSFYGTGPIPGAYGASGLDGFGNFSPNGAQFNPNNPGAYSSMQGYYGNPQVDRFNYGASAGGMFGGCGSTEVRIENACQSTVEIQLDADPNLYASANTFVLEPNQNQRIRISGGYRIGKYNVAVNAHVKGSQEPSKEISLVSVLIKSPTEVNADCIKLDRDKFKFNDFIQKPINGKVINKCYDAGVRLVPSADTISIASYFSGPGDVLPTPNGSATSTKNSMVKDIQLIGVQTEGSGSDTIQTLEFQIFPDFQQYKRVGNPFQGGGIGQQLSDLKFFAEGQFYRAESYGTISVKYLDPYGGAQQKPFPVIFEDLWKISGILDIGDGSPSITKFQDCINPDALQYRNTGTDAQNTSAKVPLEFSAEDLTQGRLAVYVTTVPNEVLIANDASCGGSDFLNDLKTTELSAKDNPNVKATFSIAGKRNIQVMVNIPDTLASDTVIEGRLNLSLTRTMVNSGTQDVFIPVKITIKHGTAPLTNQLALLSCTALGNDYAQGGNFEKVYGFEKIKWDWTYEGSPACSNQFCDATQLSIYLSKQLKKFNTFLSNNKAAFSDLNREYSTSTWINDIHEQIAPITEDTDTGQTERAQRKKYTFFAANDGGILSVPTTGNLPVIQKAYEELRNDSAQATSREEDKLKSHVEFVKQKMNSIDGSSAGGLANQLMIVLNAPPLKSKNENILLTLLGADLVRMNGTEKYVWTYGEYKQFHEMARAAATDLRVAGFAMTPLNKDAWKLKAGSIQIDTDSTEGAKQKKFISNRAGTMPMADDTTSNGFTPMKDDGKVWISYEALLDIYSAVESVRVGMLVPEDPRTLSNEDSTYVLLNAKKKPGFVFAPYTGEADLRDQFLDMTVYLQKDQYSKDMLTDLSNVVGTQDYDYKINFNSKDSSVFKTITEMKFASDDRAQSLLDAIELRAPGRYHVKIVAGWKGGDSAVKGLTIHIPTSGIEFTSLDSLDKKAGNGQKWASNIFFSIPFNGITRNDQTGSREGYGISYSIQNELGSNNPLLLGIDTPVESTTGGVSTLTIKNHSSLEGIADFVNPASEGQPRIGIVPKILSLKTSGNNYTLDYAPSIPIPLRVKFSNPGGLSTFQYQVREASRPNPTLLVHSPILWSDCTQKTPYTIGVRNGPSCRNQGGQQSFTPDGAGNIFTYTGLALVPSGSQYSLDAICAMESAQVIGPLPTDGGNVTNTPGSNLVNVSLAENSLVRNAPKTLQDILALVSGSNPTACAKVSNTEFTIVWDAKAVTPPALSCQAP